MMTDPISDMLTRIRNAQMVKKSDVVIPFSKVKFEIAKVLKHENYVLNVEKVDDTFPQMKIALKYTDGKPAIDTIKRISTPGRRVYVKKEDIKDVLNGFGVSILSTSQGLMTNKEAKRKGVGGEIICELW